MKIVILTVDHLYSNFILKELSKRFGKEIKLIIEPTKQLQGKSNFQAVLYYLKISGIYYVAIQILKLLIYKTVSCLYSTLGTNTNNKFYRYDFLTKKLGIKIKYFADINSKESILTLQKIKPDLIVSVLFSHIIKKDLLGVASKGIINFHPAYLPNYKGISPIFWSLANGEKYSGATVHYINKGIDTGNIITRKKVVIRNSDSEDSLYWRSVKLAPQMLIKAISDIESGRIQSIINHKGTYYSFPSQKAVKKFRNKGRAFFKIREYLFAD